MCTDILDHPYLYCKKLKQDVEESVMFEDTYNIFGDRPIVL